MSSIKQRERADQRVAPQPPQFPSTEAAKAVLGDNQARYIQHQREHLDMTGVAQTKRNQHAAKLDQIARLQEEARRLETEIQHTDYVAAEQKDKADGYALVLTTFGQQLPPVSATPQPQSGAGDLSQQVANWNGYETGAFAPPQSPHDAPAADGYCINCREPVWKSETGPRGATHSFGPTCDPANKDSTYADLGNPPAGGAV
jgi:hypothetical protein